MFDHNIETNLTINSLYLKFNDCKQWNSDNDEDCSYSSCECSSYSDENRLIDNNPTLSISHINDSLGGLKKYDRFSISHNRPSIEPLEEFQTEITPAEFLSTKRINEHQSEHLSSNDKHKLSTGDFQHIYEMIDQSYTKIPFLYHSIKQTKLDIDFILSVNDYLDRLKANIYKDLIRRETLLRNGKNHTRNLISLIRSICKISYEQALEIPENSIISKHAILYTMTAIDYILQNNFPQKKPLFNYILNEYISMWLHESLRIIQEDFCIIIENGRKTNLFSLCICFFHKLESICAINWERLQLIQSYRLTHFDQLLKPTSTKLEANKDFLLLFGKPLQLTMKKSEIPLTSLYSNRTDNELNNIEEIHHIFRKSIAKILQNSIEEDHKLILSESYSQQKITPTSVLVSETETESIKHTSLPLHPSSDMCEQRQSRSKLVSLEHEQLSTSIEMTSKQNQPSSQSDSSLSHSQTSTKTKSDTSPLIKIIEPISIFNEPTSIPTSINLFPQLLLNTSTSISSTKTESQNDIIEKSNSLSNSKNEDKLSINLLSNDRSRQKSSNLTCISPKQPFTGGQRSPSSHQTLSDKITTTDSKSILNAEVNALINFLTELTYSPASVQQRKETSPLLKQLEFCLTESKTKPNLIVDKIRTTHPQSSLSVKDPLFLTEFTRVLRQELEDALILREIDCGQLNEDSQNIGYLSFETSNILKLPNRNISMKKKETAAGDNIDQNRVTIEIIHDPSRCSPNHESPHPKYFSCTSPSQQYQRFNHNNLFKSTDTPLFSPKSNNHQSSSLASKDSQKQWYWIRSL